MILIVAGSRTFENDDVVFGCLDRLSADIDMIIHGGCPTGPDAIADAWAWRCEHEVKRFPADWKKHGRAAGPIRNREMAKFGTHLLAFWDGNSPGTKSMIDIAEEYDVQTIIVRTDQCHPAT